MGIKHFISSSEPKEIKTTFMPKIKRLPKSKLFNNKMSSNLTKYLFDFFDYKEIYEMGKIDLFFMNNIIDYLKETEPWPEKVRKLKSKYNFSILQNEVDLNLEEAKICKRRYKYHYENNKNVNYYQFDIDGDQYISIARTFDWAHKYNDMYWREQKIEGSYEKNENVPYLNTVCWIDTNFSFLHVKPNNYKLYINEHFVSDYLFIEKVTLKVIIDENIIVYQKNFPSKQIFDDNNSKNSDDARLKEDFICLIKKEDFNQAKKDENGDCLIKIQFKNLDDWWKSGWFIDGGTLKEITKKELDEEIELINKKKEEEEKKGLFNFCRKDKEDEKDEEDDFSS